MDRRIQRGREAVPPAWARALLAWFTAHRRAMPWRDRPDPYRVWISEIMLQQTRVAAAIPYFERFLRRFPTLPALASADLEDVLRLWEGLGYYSRARHLHQTARLLQDRHGGRIPSDPAQLRALPGIGAYTAGAVASIGFGVPVPAVDGNVLRVMARLRGTSDDSRAPAAVQAVTRFLARIVPRVPPSAFNQALMELGALVCLPRQPRCTACPLRPACSAFRTGHTELPRRRPTKALPHHDIAVGVIRKNGRILLTRRREDQMLGGLWEFPGGKRRPGESRPATVRREVREETGLIVRVGRPYPSVEHAYSHFRITLTAFHCLPLRGTARPRAAAALRWIRPADLPDYPLPRANRRIAQALLAEQTGGGAP